jgi:hypothetical protein
VGEEEPGEDGGGGSVLRAALERLKETGRGAVEGIEEHGRRFRERSVRLAWTIGLALVSCAVLLVGALALLAALYLGALPGLGRPGAAALTGAAALVAGLGGVLLSRRLSR